MSTSQLPELPAQMVDAVADNMSILALVKLRASGNEGKRIADRKIVKYHQETFGVTDKDITNMIKDLVLHSVFKKLESTLKDPTLADAMLSYGIGQVVGRVKGISLFRSRVTFPSEPDKTDISLAIKTMDRLAIEYPTLTNDIRIATHHYIKKLVDHDIRDVDDFSPLEVLELKHPGSVHQYEIDIQQPNQGHIIRKKMYDRFYGNPALQNVPTYAINEVNGLRRNSITDMILTGISFNGYDDSIELDKVAKTISNIRMGIDKDVRLDKTDKKVLNQFVDYKLQSPQVGKFIADASDPLIDDYEMI
jgi:hypothetical protein